MESVRVLVLCVHCFLLSFITYADCFFFCIGAMAAGSSIFYLQPYKNGMIHVALVLQLVYLVSGSSFFLESGKRKKKNLLKAAEIREEHSTENEVEKARALVENLDDFDELDEIIESLPENVRKEDKAQQLSAWMNLMILKMIWKRMKWRTLKKRSLM